VGGWRRLHNEELHNLYSPLNIIRVAKSRKWVSQITRTEEKRNAYKVLVGKYERMRTLRRPRHRWEDNIRIDLK
jgi:hypothetical protein